MHFALNWRAKNHRRVSFLFEEATSEIDDCEASLFSCTLFTEHWLKWVIYLLFLSFLSFFSQPLFLVAFAGGKMSYAFMCRYRTKSSIIRAYEFFVLRRRLTKLSSISQTVLVWEKTSCDLRKRIYALTIKETTQSLIFILEYNSLRYLSFSSCARRLLFVSRMVISKRSWRSMWTDALVRCNRVRASEKSMETTEFLFPERRKLNGNCLVGGTSFVLKDEMVIRRKTWEFWEIVRAQCIFESWRAK